MTPIPQTLKRINRELKTIQDELPEGILSVGPKSTSNLFDWKGSIAGPSGSCYEGGVFQFNIHLPHDYPFHPPKVTFTTRIFHPNIDQRGGICLDILKHKWSPALSILKVLLSILCLLTDPNPQDPLVGEIARLYLNNRSQFEATAKQWVNLHARPPLQAQKAKDQTKKAATIPPSQSQNPVVIINDDDEIEVVKPSQSRSSETSSGTRKRMRDGTHLNSLSSTSYSGHAPQNPSTDPTPSNSKSQPKRPRHQVIELD